MLWSRSARGFGWRRGFKKPATPYLSSLAGFLAVGFGGALVAMGGAPKTLRAPTLSHARQIFSFFQNSVSYSLLYPP